MIKNTPLIKDIAEKFLKNNYSVDLSIFKDIEDAAAQALAEHKGHIYLMGLEKLSHYGATQLVNLPSASMSRSYLGSAAQKVFKEAGTWDNQTWIRNP
jgi:hypothetical protein